MKKTKRFMPGHLSNFEDAQEILDYEYYIYLGGAMTEIQEDYNKEWEREFQEELCKKVLEEDPQANKD